MAALSGRPRPWGSRSAIGGDAFHENGSTFLSPIRHRRPGRTSMTIRPYALLVVSMSAALVGCAGNGADGDSLPPVHPRLMGQYSTAATGRGSGAQGRG